MIFNSYSLTQIVISIGFAYYGDSSAWTGSVITNVTCTYLPFIHTYINLFSMFLTLDIVSFSANPGALSANALTDGVTIPDNTLLYVIPNATSPQPIGFTGSKTTPSGAVTDRWTFYETYASYEDSTGQLNQYFYVKETDVKGVWQVYWDNADEVSGYTRITVRNHAPY
jgi:hypothetical protein